MIRATELLDQAIVDKDQAAKLGNIDELILDPEGCRVAAFLVGRDRSFKNSGQTLLVDAATVHAIGPDAITVSDGTAGSPAPEALDTLPPR